MTDAGRKPIAQQVDEAVGKRVSICRCRGCGLPFLAPRRTATWCSGACRKAVQKSKVTR